VSLKVTVPPVGDVVPAFTVAVMVNTDWLAALEGVTESVVAVVVCAPATAHDIAMNKAVHREVRGRLLRATLARASAFLDLPGSLSALSELCSKPIAAGLNVVRKQDCERTYLAAAIRNQCELCVVLADDADWRKRNEEAAPRGVFINSDISKPFN